MELRFDCGQASFHLRACCSFMPGVCFGYLAGLLGFAMGQEWLIGGAIHKTQDTVDEAELQA
jgi:hypothetical protein